MENEVNTQEETKVVTVDNEKEKEVQEELISKDKLNEIVSTRVKETKETALKELYTRYGVNTAEELDDVISKAESYDVVNEDYTKLTESSKTIKQQNQELLQENLFIKNKISPERYDDVKAIFKGKGLEFSKEELATQLETHPEWCANVNDSSKSTIKVGADKDSKPHKLTEDEKTRRIFGL